ncbi:MAG: hypothetical protein DRP82_07210 [Planctomycetota bacterium]|nr:MAG: hypothetical protein DRP82_07210 [Planctomycetota bacterium]
MRYSGGGGCRADFVVAGCWEERNCQATEGAGIGAEVTLRRVAMRAAINLFLLLPAFLIAQEKGVIFGVVVDQHDELVLECRVKLLKLSETGKEAVEEVAVRGRQNIPCDGVFTFLDVPAGEYILVVVGKHLRQLEKPKLTVKAGEFRFVALRVKRVKVRPGAIRGVVLIGRESVEGVAVQLMRENEKEPLATTTTGRRGRYEFTNLEPGRYVVVVRHKGIRLASEDVEVKPGHTVSKSIRLPESRLKWLRGRLYGEVRDSRTRRPIFRARVRIEKAPKGFHGKTSVTCDSEGKFDFGYLPPGRYTISASASGYRKETKTVRIRERGRHRLSFSLKRQKRR